MEEVKVNTKIKKDKKLSKEQKKFIDNVNKELSTNKKIKEVELRKGEPDFREMDQGNINQLLVRAISDISMCLKDMRDTQLIIAQDYEIISKLVYAIDLYEQRKDIAKETNEYLQKLNIKK